jgi:hypothetical protein
MGPADYSCSVYFFGFFWGCVNIFVWFLLYLPVAWKWISPNGKSTNVRPHQSEKPIYSSHRLWWWWALHALVVLPIAVIMALGPFFSPSIGVKLAQKVS